MASYTKACGVLQVVRIVTILFRVMQRYGSVHLMHTLRLHSFHSTRTPLHLHFLMLQATVAAADIAPALVSEYLQCKIRTPRGNRPFLNNSHCVATVLLLEYLP